MKQRYNDLTLDICEEAVRKGFKGKWKRKDILLMVNKYAGINSYDILLEFDQQDKPLREEAVHSIGLFLYGEIEEILNGYMPEEFFPVKERQKRDRSNGKIRNIAMLCLMHQLIGHVTYLLLEPLFKGQIVHSQHASIPGHGQTRLKNESRKKILKSLGIKHFVKTDCRHAYASLQYSVLNDIIRKEIPSAKHIHKLMDFLGSVAPGGHLIIGGYIDSWLFNFAMSYAIRYLMSLRQVRRGKEIPYVILCECYMDDLCLYGSNEKLLKMATRKLDRWVFENLGMKLKTTTGIIKLLPIAEENRRKHLPKKAQRGVPSVDMAGFRISRSHVRIRSRIFLRSRRQWLRAWKEYQETGTLRIQRARKITCYNGYIKQTDSETVRIKYHTDELLAVAKKVVSNSSKARKRRKDELRDEMFRIAEYLRPIPGDCGISAK